MTAKFAFTTLLLLFLQFIAAALQVPVLCYHQVRDWKSIDSRSARPFIIPPERFRQHMKMLADSGYHTITLAQLSAHLKYKKPLPPKPVMVTFDDGTDSQYANALPELLKRRFNAVFFIMTVTIGRPGYLSQAQIRSLAEKGFTIGCHTWDHHNVTRYSEEDWQKQLVKPTAQLEKITGLPVTAFAYPYGACDEAAMKQLKNNGYELAFQLEGKINERYPTLSIRRIIADGSWSAHQLDNAIKKSFK